MNLNISFHSNASLQWTPGPAPRTTITLYSILLVWSLLGNVLVIAVVYYNQNLRTNLNYLIVVMAVSDLLVPLVRLPWMILSETVRPGEWLVEGPLGEALCKLVPFLSEISPCVSSISLVVIAVQRFIAVVYPTRRQILTHKTRRILISFPWIVAMALFSPYFYIYRLTKEVEYTVCEFSWSPAFDSIIDDMIFTFIVITVTFITPFITIIILYTIIVYQLRKSLNNVIKLIDRETIRSRQRRNRKIFGMVIAIIVMFTICWCPLAVLNLLYVYRHPLLSSMDDETKSDMLFALYIMWNLLPAISPCTYFVFLKDFRQGLKRLCYRRNEPCVCFASTVTPGENVYRIHPPHVIYGSHRMNINTTCPRTPDTDSNQDPTCTPPHIYTTSV